MSKFGLPCAFLDIPFKEKDVSIFSYSINVTVTSQNDVPSFQMKQSIYTCFCCIHLKSSHFVLCIALKWLKRLSEDQNKKLRST